MPDKKYPDAVGYMPLIIESLLICGGSEKASVVKDWVAHKLEGAGELVPDAILKSGVSKFANDLQWARLYLVRGGLLETKANAGYGIWKLSGNGWTTRLDEAGARAIYDAVSKPNKPHTHDASESPEQLEIEETYDYRKQLADILQGMEAGQFETLCMKIMSESGFEPHRPPSHAYTPDGGIDGEGMLSMGGSLVKIKVAWQCKRFKDALVGSQVVRDFRGAIDGKTQYGIIFTSSSFTQNARNEAKRTGTTPIELFGLEEMIKLLEEKQMGVEPVQTFRVVAEFFKNLPKYIGVQMSLKAAS